MFATKATPLRLMFLFPVVNRATVAVEIAAACLVEFANAKDIIAEPFRFGFYDVEFGRVHATDVPSSDVVSLRKAQMISFAWSYISRPAS